MSLESILAAFCACWWACQPQAHAQCEPGQSEVVVEILTDNYPGEITWTLSDASGELLSGGPYQSTGTTYTETVAIDGADTCLQFVINDESGDGTVQLVRPRGLRYLDREAVATGSNYGQQDIVQFDCAPGATCNDAVSLTDADYGVVSQADDNFLYSFACLQRHVPVQLMRRGATRRCTSTTTATWATSTTRTRGPSTTTTTRAVAAKKLRDVLLSVLPGSLELL